MDVLIISQTNVPELLPMNECIQVIEQAFTTLAQGDAVLPLRPVLSIPDQDGLLCMMPAYLGNIQSIGAKVFSVFSNNHGTEYDVHQGTVLLFETTNGCLQAIVDATSITAIRTAAASAVATKLLAQPDADDLAILGSGTQAQAHLEAQKQADPFPLSA